MAGKFPPLFRRGGPEAVADYVAEFDLLYRSGDVTDIWGRVVEFFGPVATRLAVYLPTYPRKRRG